MFRYSESELFDTIEPKPSLLHAMNIEDEKAQNKLQRNLDKSSGAIDIACYIASLKVKPDILFLFNSCHDVPTGYSTLCQVLVDKAGYTLRARYGDRATLYAWPNNPYLSPESARNVVRNITSKECNRGKSFEVLWLNRRIDRWRYDAYEKLCEIYDEVKEF